MFKRAQLFKIAIVFFVAIFCLSLFFQKEEQKNVVEAQSQSFNCAEIRANNPGQIIFCEDFEDPALDTDIGWETRFGTEVRGDCQGPYNASQGIFVNAVGTCATCCVDIVTQGNCDAAGENNCVWKGSRAKASRFVHDRTQGIHGRADFSEKVRTFGVTMAVKWSANYATPTVANKMNEFGNCAHPIIGASTNNTTGQSNTPWEGSFFSDGGSLNYTPLKGLWSVVTANTTAKGLKWTPATSDYNFNVTQPKEEWGCLQLHVTNWGLSNARIRQWWTPASTGQQKLLLEATNIDMSHLRAVAGYCPDGNDQDGIDKFYFNNYYNNQSTDPNRLNGYPSNAPDAARYEDNIVVTKSGEPVSCAQIGFASSGTPTDNYPSISASVSPASITVGSSVSLSATASDDKGVSGVQFKVNGVNQGSEDTTSPYSLTYSPTVAGTYTITAVARDTIGQTTTSNPATLTVSASPPTQTCGNNTKEGTEVCDGSALSGQSCTTQGFSGGSLSCNASCTAFVTSACTSTPPAGGLVASYSFDNTATDASGSGNNGTLTNGPTYTTGHTNQALLFDGVDDYVELGNKLDLSFPFTISAWVRLDSGASGDPVIFASDDDANYTGFKMFIEGAGDNRVGVDLMNGGTPGPSSRNSRFSQTKLSYGTWTHVAAVVTGINNITLYVNGVAEGSTAYSGAATSMVHTTSPARIGRRSGNQWKGAIDDLKLYSKALTASEVSALYNPTPPPTTLSNLTFSLSTDTNRSLTNQSLSVSILPGGSTSQTTPLESQTITANSTSQAILTTTSRTAGSYDVRIKGPTTLSRKQTFTLASNSTYTFTQKLISGDLNNDNSINSLDWSLMSTDWFQTGKTSDLNGDNITNALDFTWLNRNWYLQGE